MNSIGFSTWNIESYNIERKKPAETQETQETQIVYDRCIAINVM